VIFHDLTERIAIDERVRLLSSVVAESDSMIVIIDAGQRILYGNPAFERSSGYSLAEVEERNAGSTLIAAPDTPAESLQRICEAIKGQKAATAEIVSRRKNGIAYWVEVHVAPVLDTRGLCTHFVAIGYDITERKRAAGVKEAQTKLLALGADVGRAITTGVSLADMLDRCAAALMRHLDAAFVRIWTTSPRRTC
jgi:PAS domain S-box-containing protein